MDTRAHTRSPTQASAGTAVLVLFALGIDGASGATVDTGMLTVMRFLCFLAAAAVVSNLALLGLQVRHGPEPCDAASCVHVSRCQHAWAACRHAAVYAPVCAYTRHTSPPSVQGAENRSAPSKKRTPQARRVDCFAAGRLAQACAQVGLLLLWVVVASVSTGLLASPVQLNPVSGLAGAPCLGVAAAGCLTSFPRSSCMLAAPACSRSLLWKRHTLP